MAETWDAVVVGGGHNGLITAAYLAKNGWKVLVLERRPDIGGAVATDTHVLPGYRIDTGSSAHIMIHQTPVFRDLDLGGHGLEYLEMDPWGYAPSVEGGPAIRFYRDLDRTVESIAAVSPEDAERYREFARAWTGIGEGALRAFLGEPTPPKLIRAFFGKSIPGCSRLEMLRKIFSPYGQMLEESFGNEQLRTAILWLAAQSGPPPSEVGTANFAGWHVMYHQSGMKRAKGGSGALTRALRNRIEADGGTVRTDAPVRQILTDPASLRITGVELEDGERVAARRVVAACHIKTTVDTLLSESALPGRLRERVNQLRIGNGFGMIVRCAMRGLPPYRGEAFDERGVGSCHHGLQLLAASRREIDNAYADYLRGRPPEQPVPLAMTFSALDPSLAPPDRHTLFIWGQYHPYELRNGEHWDEIREREADKLLAAVDRFAPGTSDLVEDRFIQTPLDIERLHGHHRGNVMHLEMSLDQMFFFRPLPELSRYRVPAVEGLYLTGASTHPGGGVWGASGHNTAQVLLKRGRRKT